MSTKRARPAGSSGGERPSKIRPSTSKIVEEKVEPDSKRSKKEPPAAAKTPVKVPPTKENGGSLGGLPLYGEKLPKGGFDVIPTNAHNTCEKLRRVMERVKHLKSNPGNKQSEDIAANRKTGLLLFAQLRKLNRLSNLYIKEGRDNTQEHKMAVDELHLQLQNLRYEATHFEKEIKSCLEFRSKHEEIDLIDIDEFYATAPESISKPDETKNDPHKQMLARLDWELEQRKQMVAEQNKLEQLIKEKMEDVKKLEDKLSSLKPSLEKLREATLPIQEFFNMPLDFERDQYKLASHLPLPLYMLYIQALGYSKAEDPLLKVVVNGDADEAMSFKTDMAQQDMATAEESDSDHEGESSQRKKKKRKKGSSVGRQEPLFTKAFPLTVDLVVSAKDLGSITVSFHHLPYFTATCAVVKDTKLEGLTDAHSNLFIDKMALLHCLQEGDSGRTSPNAAISHKIRKYGGDNFSTAVRQFGFPYKWVQRACGIVIPSDIAEDVEVRPDRDVAAEGVVEIVKLLRERFMAHVMLTKQLYTLEQLKLPSPHTSDTGISTSSKKMCQLIRWKQITLQDVQNSGFGGLVIFNVQERTNRFYLATFQLGQARIHSIICVTPEYPKVRPSVAILVELTEKQREPYDIQIKNIERELNLETSFLPPEEKLAEKLLLNQIHHLQQCTGLYIHYRTKEGKKSPSSSVANRGKGRLLSFQA